jgi:uncharacterized hydrophobic protein (TIGR00341 family)
MVSTNGNNSLYDVRELIHSNASISQSFIIMNALASIVASYGLLVNSTAVVIGAMVIAALLGPITGIALGLVDGDNDLLRKAIITEIVGVFLVMAISFLIGRIHSDVPLGTEIMARTAPNILDLIIALAGGAAGAYAMASPRVSAGLVGVAIATALVPPLSSSSILLARGETRLAMGAFLLFLANFVAIQFSSSFILWLLGYHKITHYDSFSAIGFIRRNIFSLVVLIILTVILGINFSQTVEKQILATRIREIINTNLETFSDAQLVDINISEENSVIDLQVTIRTSRTPTYAEIVNLQRTIAVQIQRPVSLKVIDVPTVKLDPLIPPTYTPTSLPEPSATPTATPTVTPTNTPTPTATPTVTNTPTPTPTFTPTPVSAVVDNFEGEGVVLRDKPGGKITGTLPNSAPVLILYQKESIDGVEWVEIEDVLGRTSWVLARYLQIVP